MKVLFIANQFGFFRHLEPVAISLLEKGHQIEIWFGSAEKPGITDRGVRDLITKYNLENYRKFARKKNLWQVISRFFRDLLGYRTYLRPGLTSAWYKNHYLGRMGYFARLIAQNPTMRRFLSGEDALLLLRSYLQRIPADRKIISELHKAAPDVVIVTTNLPWEAPDLEYLKACTTIGIPTAIQIASWDNLTTKSTFYTIPDAILVWNKYIEDEAIKLHDVPKDKIVVTGAATFDYLFSLRESCTFLEFCQRTGLAGDKPYIIYLGSSSSVAGNETIFVRDFVRSLRKSLNVDVLIRPHPVNYRVWSEFNEPGSIVWPRIGELPDTVKAKKDFWDALHHSLAIVGVNTSAMIEAAIVDKPCITIKSEQFSSSQSETGHFRHLINGKFLEFADDFEDAISLIKDIIAGVDRLHGNRKDFATDFIRPNGIKQPVGPLIAETLVMLGKKKNANDINDWLAQNL
jgi:hypothetical protein